MSKLNLSVAIGDYDRNRPLINGAVQDRRRRSGVHEAGAGGDLLPRVPHPGFRHLRVSLSSFTLKTARGDCPYVGIPAFVSRMFRHTSIYVRTDRIKKPKDLKGRKVGVPEYQLTANVWARAILEDDFGVKPRDMHWIRGGIEHAGRPEKITRQAAAGRAARQRAGGQDDLGAARRGRDRRLHRAAPAVDGGQAQACRLAVPRSDRGRRPTTTSAPACSRSCI